MNLPPCSALRLYNVFPCASVSTVAPSVPLEAVLTRAADPLAGAAVLEEDPVPELLLPHAASVRDAASAGRRNFTMGRIGTPSQPRDEMTAAVSNGGWLSLKDAGGA